MAYRSGSRCRNSTRRRPLTSRITRPSVLPRIDGEGKTVRIIAGSLFGKASPVKTLSPLFYADAAVDSGASFLLNNDYDERGIYLLEGDVDIHGQRFAPGRLLVFSSGDEITIKAVSAARFVVFGGEPLDGPRHVWWNFVSSSRERIEQAKSDWKSGRFAPVPGDPEFIPLPSDGWKSEAWQSRFLRCECEFSARPDTVTYKGKDLTPIDYSFGSKLSVNNFSEIP